MNQTNKAVRIYTIQSAAETLSVEEKSVRRLIKAGLLECFRVGASIRITESQLGAYIKRTTETGVSVQKRKRSLEALATQSQCKSADQPA
jgi:excisionase family DNA binding protein